MRVGVVFEFLNLKPSDRKDKDSKTPVRAVVLFGYIGRVRPPEGTAASCQVVPDVEI